MDNILRIITIITILIMSSCTLPDEYEKNNVETNKGIKKDIRVLILGNSILRHDVAPNLGWYGDWGMAATAPDKDFLHVYTKSLMLSNHYNNVDIKSKNIAVWENDFNFNLNQFVDISAQFYDILIIRLGENVSNTLEYYTALNNMINTFKTQNTKVIITGVIWAWDNNNKELIHEQVALDNGYSYISYEAFRNNPANYSWGLFSNSSVAAHPSDLGMENIAQTLYNKTLEIH